MKGILRPWPHRGIECAGASKTGKSCDPPRIPAGSTSSSMPKIRGSRDTRDWAPEFNTEEPEQSVPFCPGCWEDAPYGSYPPALKGNEWWCSFCLHQQIKQLRGGDK